MRNVYIAPAVFPDLLESAEWYEVEQEGLGADLLLEVDSVLEQIAIALYAVSADRRGFATGAGAPLSVWDIFSRGWQQGGSVCHSAPWPRFFGMEEACAAQLGMRLSLERK
jgi:hypothetical protein